MFKELFVAMLLCTASLPSLTAQDKTATIIKDEFEGSTKTASISSFVDVDDSSFLNIKKLFLEIWKIQKPGADDVFLVRVVLIQKEWLFINPGESLILLVDGERIGLKSGSGSNSRRVILKPFIREDAWYNLDLATARKMCAGKEVKVKVVGPAKFVFGKMKDEGVHNLQVYGENWLKDSPDKK